MIIEHEQDVTRAVVSELERAPDPRFRQIMSAFVRHLHDFAREVRLTEQEFRAAIGYIVRLGRHTTETHNEAVLMAGSLGLSQLIVMLNNGHNGQVETDASLLVRSGACTHPQLRTAARSCARQAGLACSSVRGSRRQLHPIRR